MFENHLKEKMAKGPVYGMTIYTGSPAVIEAAGQFGSVSYTHLDRMKIRRPLQPMLLQFSRISDLWTSIHIT